MSEIWSFVSNNQLISALLAGAMLGLGSWVLLRFGGAWQRLAFANKRRNFGAIRTLMAINEMAAESYGQSVSGDRQGPRTGIWDAMDWMRLRNFVDPPVGGNVHGREGAMDVTAKASRQGEKCHVWIRGPAGSGKTTLLVRLYFEFLGVVGEHRTDAGHAEAAKDGRMAGATGLSGWFHTIPWSRMNHQRTAACPTPMLIRPRKLVLPKPLPAGQDWFESMVEAWMSAQVFKVDDDVKGHFIDDLKVSLRAGRVVLLIDGYDEINQSGPSDAIRRLFDFPLIVCADRSDRALGPYDLAIVLPPRWPPATCAAYLRGAWKEGENWADVVLERLSWPEARWLRNPGYFVSLVAVLEQRRSQGTLTEDSLLEVTRGHLDVFERVLASAFERLEALPQASSREPVIRQLAQLAADQIAGKDGDRGPKVSTEMRKVPEWLSAEYMTEIVATTVVSDGAHLRIAGLPFLDYFQAQHLVDELVQGQLPSAVRRLSLRTLAVADAMIRRLTEPETTVELLWELLARDLHKLRERGWTDAAVSNLSETLTHDLALNVLELGVGLAKDLQEDARKAPRPSRRVRAVIRNRILADLDLEGANLRNLEFESCRFDRSSLKDAGLQGSTFKECSFAETDLSGADATRASFDACSFKTLGNVTGLQIPGAQLPSTLADALLSSGAKRFRSRYQGGWFGASEEWMLGGDYAALDREYRRQIRAAIEPHDRDDVYMIDLMAGGSDGLIGALHDGFPRLHILAVDRDRDQLDVLARGRERLSTWEVNLNGGGGESNSAADAVGVIGPALDLKGPMRSASGWSDGAHLIVGKKALHEVPRELQGLLIGRCYAALRDGGRMVLFTDSPWEMAADGHDRLAAVRELLISGEDPRAAVMDRLSLGSGSRDRALFWNLWVMLKDWANDNEHEVVNRYFAARNEIAFWAEEHGFIGVTVVPSRQAEHSGAEAEVTELSGYRITPQKFNEAGVRFAHNYRVQHPNASDRETDEAIVQALSSGYEDRFQLLIDFTRHHLFPVPPPEGSPTALGEALNAAVEPVDFIDIHPRLSLLEEVTFDGPVHVMTFERPLSTNPVH